MATRTVKFNNSAQRKHVAALLACVVSSNVAADDLLELSLEDLMSVEVSSVSKQMQTVGDSAAAVFVITQDDIRRSGATTIADALRMVPGLEVAQVDSNKWAITSRGFNRRFANKLLVMVDGRSVYTPLFSGVFWEMQDTMLEDVARIEVIRGPGATIWGANAVNGVINIITKKSSETVGGLAAISAGTDEKSNLSTRYGFSLSENVHGRVYVKARDRNTRDQLNGEAGHDDWRTQQVGFRSDMDFGRHVFTLQGDAYVGKTGETLNLATTTTPYATAINQDSDVGGENLLTRYEYTHPLHGSATVQVYYDHTNRINPNLVGEDDREIVDIDFFHAFSVDKHDWVWGVGRRKITDRISGTTALNINPDNLSEQLISFFVQDTYSVTPALDLTAGAKIESYTYIDTAAQPNLRAIWRVTQKQSLWGAISYAERLPSRSERHISLNARTIPPASAANPSPWPIVVRLQGSNNIVSEELTAYELGYRYRRSDRMAFDVTTFLNDYGTLRTFELGSRYCASTNAAPPCPPGDYIIQPQNVGALASARTYGLELEADFQVDAQWRIRTAYTYFNLDFEKQASSTDTANVAFEGKSPEHQLSIRSQHDLRANWELDFWLRFVDELPAIQIADYWTLDIRLAWRPNDQFEFSTGVQNLFDDGRSEFTADLINTTSTLVPRALYGKAVWRF